MIDRKNLLMSVLKENLLFIMMNVTSWVMIIKEVNVIIAFFAGILSVILVVRGLTLKNIEIRLANKKARDEDDKYRESEDLDEEKRLQRISERHEEL